MIGNKVVIGSRGSRLALWQAEFLKQQLAAIGLDSEIKIIKTKGDIIQHLSLDKLEGKGFFTKEIEQALLNGEIDVAVHSHKDLPTEETPGLVIAGVSEREDPAELLLIRKDKADISKPLSLPPSAIVGTSAARRKCHLMHIRKDLQLKDIRGNVTTRVEKLRSGQFDAILLAAAGMNRLGLDLGDLHVERLEPWVFIPSAAQGILAYQTRKDDSKMKTAIAKISDTETKEIADTERKVMSLLGGGCQHPIGVYVRKQNGLYQMWVMRAKDWRDKCKRYYFSENTTGNLIDKIKNKDSNSSSASIFISRDLEADSYFYNYLKDIGYQVTGESLVEFKPLEFQLPKAFDWIFFSSRNAVRFFFNNDLVKVNFPQGVKIAAIGKGTAKEVQNVGYEVDFYGNDTETSEVAKEFEKFAVGKTVLFPQALNSLQTIQKGLPKSVVSIELPVYNNSPKKVFNLPFSSYNILVFTSPMNVQTFLNHGKILPHQRVIAIGHTTSLAFSQAGISQFHISYEPSENALADTVMGII